MIRNNYEVQDGSTFTKFSEDGKRVFHKSMSNDMSKAHKAIYYAITLWGNRIINKLPSFHVGE